MPALKTEAELVKRQAMLLPQTFAAFCGSSGRSVKIWVCFALPDGNLPKREQEAALFHAHAYRLANKPSGNGSWLRKIRY